MDNIHSERPFVTVIVPVFNDAERIEICIESLLSQSYPSQKYEIIVVDNGSTDTTPDKVRNFHVKYLSEKKMQSSYAARNKGIRYSAGDIIAFTDSDCLPSPDWISAGVKALYDQRCDLIGGDVKFILSRKWSAAEIFDSLNNMQIEKNVLDRKVGKTANLFVKSNVIQKIGLFPDNLESGGDVIWTRKAVKSGFKIGYSDDAAVAHPARSLRQLIYKQYRVGKGQPHTWMQEGLSQGTCYRRIFKTFLPTSSLSVLDNIRKKKQNITLTRALRVLLVIWICQITAGMGNIRALHLMRIIERVERVPE